MIILDFNYQSDCDYKYRTVFDEKINIWGAQIGKLNEENGEIEIIAMLMNFKTENECYAAIWGFIEAINYPKVSH